MHVSYAEFVGLCSLIVFERIGVLGEVVTVGREALERGVGRVVRGDCGVGGKGWGVG